MGFEYLVLSSFIYRLARVDPVEDRQRRSFYRSLDTDARLLAEFQPAEDSRQTSFFCLKRCGFPSSACSSTTDRGRRFKIYKIQPCPTSPSASKT